MATALEMLLSQVQPRQAAPVVEPLTVGPFAPDTALQEPPASGMDALWQRLGSATGGGPVLPHIPFRRGGRQQDGAGMALLALLSGYANAKTRMGFKAGEESKLFRKQAQQDVDARVQARNLAFADAKKKAADVRETRRKQMEKALEGYLSDAEAADTRARSAGDATLQANHVAARDAAVQRYTQIANDLAKLTGSAPRVAPTFGTLTKPAPKPVRAAAAPKPAKVATPKPAAAPAKPASESPMVGSLRMLGVKDKATLDSYLNQKTAGGKSVSDALGAATVAELRKAFP